MNDARPVYVYEWKAWSRYLFPSLCERAIRIEAKFRQSNRRILLFQPAWFSFQT